MSTTINGTSGVTFPDGTNQTTSPFTGGLGFRNRIINGDFRIDQRNAGASVSTASGSSTYTIDRWYIDYSQTSKFTIQQNAGSVTPPTGFSNYLGVTSSSSYSVLAADYFILSQNIEGFNFSDMNWGTANAVSVTLSFWVRSSLTGNFGGCLQNSAGNRSYPFSYTISSANTWEQKTITIAGDTTGTWVGATNGTGVKVRFGLGFGSNFAGTANTWAGSYIGYPTGSTSVVGTNGATFYITGVQLEKGSTATSFDYRPYGTELALCQRYYQVYTQPTNAFRRYMQNVDRSTFILPVQMRATPTNTTTYSPTGAAMTFSYIAINSSVTRLEAQYPGGGNGVVDIDSYTWTLSAEL